MGPILIGDVVWDVDEMRGVLSKHHLSLLMFHVSWSPSFSGGSTTFLFSDKKNQLLLSFHGNFTNEAGITSLGQATLQNIEIWDSSLSQNCVERLTQKVLVMHLSLVLRMKQKPTKSPGIGHEIQTNFPSPGG